MIHSYLTCYHGTIDVYAYNIKENINLSAGRYFTDFGQGFYITNNYEQAEEWALKKFSDKISEYENIRPAIVKIHLDTCALEACRGQVFHSSNDNWANFVYNCRKQGKYRILYHGFDFCMRTTCRR